MANTNRTPAQMNPNAATEDVVVASANGDSISTGNTWTVLCSYNDDVLLVFYTATGTATISLAAGTEPPSPRANKGSTSFTMATGTVKLFAPEKGRHLNNSGNLVFTITTQTVVCSAYRLPPGFIAPLITYNGTNNS